MADILIQHDIEVFELTEQQQIKGVTYAPGQAWVVPTRQRQYRLIKALMMRHSEFQDTTFYDVSTWAFPLAFDRKGWNVPVVTGGKCYSRDLAAIDQHRLWRQRHRSVQHQKRAHSKTSHVCKLHACARACVD